MSPKVIAILVVILLVIFGGMALTMKRAANKSRERAAWTQDSPNLLSAHSYSVPGAR